MGYYINPPDKTKEEFLKQHGRVINRGEFLELAGNIKDATSLIPVCLVNNGHFNAAGIAYSSREAEAFTDDTHRTKIFFAVPYEHIAALGKVGNGGYTIR